MRFVFVAFVFNYIVYLGVFNLILICKLIMVIRKYKININCGNCVKVVIGFLSDVFGIDYWEVDIINLDKIFLVSGVDFDELVVVEVVEDVGFDIYLVEVIN